MTDVIELKKGELYFLVGFFDNELQIPSIGTYIYEGLDDAEDKIHLFIDAIGHLNRAGQSTEEGGQYISFPEGKITGIVDKKRLIEWLRQEHSLKHVGTTYEYKAI